MNLRLFPWLTALLLSPPAVSQETKPPAFLYVDVHLSAPNAEMVGGRFRAGSRFEASGFTMLDLLARGYNLPWDRIAGGPAWIGTDRFDLIAAIPPGVPASAAQPMIQAVLAERFQLKAHDDTRPVPAYVLLSSGQPRLKESAAAESRCQFKRERATITLDCHNTSMQQLVRQLEDYAQLFFDRPIIDKTNLAGGYDFSLSWTDRDMMRVRNAEGELTGVTPQAALEKQLGLKCILRPEPMKVLVIDSVNRVPTPNAPGVTQALNSSTYTHFDVAEVRTHKEEAGFKFDDQETHITYLGFLLPVLIQRAWDTPPQRRQVMGPDWIRNEKFDVIAKPANRTAWENTQLMLRNLITESFQLRMHEEDRPTDVYALTVNRTAKLKDALPNRRSECHTSFSDPNMTMTCQNTTLRQLQNQARHQGWVTLDRPVLDQTGLKGAYDFSITWIPGPWNARQPDAPVEGMASVPTGEISFFEAMEKQLGFKLTKQKLPYPALVIDSVERAPRSNDMRIEIILIGLVFAVPSLFSADIHDEMHACVHERLPALKRAGFTAATAGDQFCLGYGYWQGVEGLPRDPVKSADWTAKAARQGHAGAQTVLAYDYEQGHGVTKNYSETVRLLRLALAQNYADAMFHMGRLFTTGKGVPRSESQGLEWFRKAAAAGSADGIIAVRQQRDLEMNAAGRQAQEAAYQAYQAGDYARAAAQYRIAANAGSPQAQNNLGTMMRLGQGIAKNPAAAVALYREAASKGYAAAQAQLGFAYEFGDGVEQDWAQAFKWCNLSARQFDKLGLYCLARQYQFGIGVTQDRVRAYRIYDRAEDAGDGMSKFFAGWLRGKQNCVGFRSESERKRFTDVCQDPAGLAFASEQQRIGWLYKNQEAANRAAMAAWQSSGSYATAACSAAGGTWGGGGCGGEGGRTFDPMQQDRSGRNLW